MALINTTHDRVIRAHPALPHPSHPHPPCPTQSGQHFTLFFVNHVNETTAVGARSSLSAFKDLRTGQTSISATECPPVRIPYNVT
eukprot:SAG25_NODE_599_length_6648_cov_22.861964_6_plen_85_part_00